MEYFTSSTVTLSNKLLEVLYIIMGLVSIYAGAKNAMDKKNPARLGTAIFWIALGIVLAFGRWIPSIGNGVLVAIMMVPAILRKVKAGTNDAPTAAETKAANEKIGMKIFWPALSIGLCAVIFALFTKLSALVGVGVGILISIILLMVYDSKKNKPMVFLNDSERLLSLVGPLSMLPMLLASLGTIFTKAGVGEVISKYVSYIIPEGNVVLGIIVFAIGMMLFTMIMGNGFAAITVMTVGIGYPFVLQYGVNPTLIGMVALTCGYCGTLCTPMAANFNIVPVALLEMKDRFGVIKWQVVPALLLLVFQIIYMIAFR